MLIINEIREAVGSWGRYAKEAGVTPSSIKLIQSLLEDIITIHSY